MGRPLDPALVGPTLSMVSGALLATLGVGLALVRPRRASTAAFAAFAVTWGLMILFGNASRVAAEPVLARTLTLLFVAMFVLVYAPLSYFVSLFPRRGLFAKSTLAGVLLLAPAALGAVALVLAPHLLYVGTTGAGPTRTDDWGPLLALFDVLFAAAFLGALVHLQRERRASPNLIDGKRATLVLTALTLFVAFDSVENVVQYLPTVLRDPAGALASIDTAVFFIDSLAGCLVIGWLANELRKERARETDRIVAWAILVPALFGAASGLTKGAFGIPFAFDTLGIFRTASVILIAYAILRFELFDIDVRVKRGTIAAGILLAAAGIAVGVERVVEGLLQLDGAALTISQFTLFGAVVVVGMRAPRLAARLGEKVLPGLHAPSRLDARRLEVYEAALAQAAAGQGLDKEEDFLRDLRASLGVSEAEHVLLARLVSRGIAAEPGGRLEAGTLVDGRYRLVRSLGEGSSGAAWLAQDARDGALVVVKALHASLARNASATRAFLREARLASSLDHPHVVRVLGHGSFGERPYLVLEHVDGGTLEDRLVGPLPPAEARRFARDILDGLAHVHAHGILHRDLKPTNVLVGAQGALKLTDFGVALEVGVDDTAIGLESPQPKGTLATMSPENVRGLPLTPPSDLYAVGAILYRMIAGHPYLRLEGRSREGARAAILTEPALPAPPGTDPHLLEVALRALEKAPHARYGSADEMRRALEPVAVTLTPDAPAPRARRPAR